jgi:hypothetical protein
LEAIIARLGGSDEEGQETVELLAAAALKKNRENALAYLRTPYAGRAVFVPQCLRSTDACQADEHGNEFLCARCGACKIAEIARRAEELGYIGVRILKGGSTLVKFVKETKPKAVLGVSCSMEGVMGIIACARAGVPAFCVPLVRAGCSDTDVDLGDVLAAMEAILP